MTIKELYEYAVANNIEDYHLAVTDDFFTVDISKERLIKKDNYKRILIDIWGLVEEA